MLRHLLCIALFAAPIHAQDPAAPADQAVEKTDHTANADPLHPRVTLTTSKGVIVLELDAAKAPLTTLNFVQYVREGYYNGTIFHRVIQGFMIQGGGFAADMVRKPTRDGIKNEWRNGLKNKRGTIAMARRSGAPDSATSQFFINVVDNSMLDQQQRDRAASAVFGRVIEGMDVVDAIKEVATDKYPPDADTPTHEDVPTEPIMIETAEVITPFDAAALEADLAAKAARAAAVVAEAIAAIETRAEKTFTKSDTGLYYMVIEEGTGPSPTLADTVEFHCTGYLLNGEEFYSTNDDATPLVLPMKALIKGWQEGIPKMKVGGKSKLVIPPYMGYGENGYGTLVPGNATLHFDVELLSIKPSPSIGS